MKLQHAAGFTAIAFLIATLFSALVQRLGLRLVGVELPRHAWLQEHQMLWALGGWLWLLAIFSWMVLLVTLMWSYIPAHRVATMLQSGLMLIAAILAIAGIAVWMNLVPVALAWEEERLHAMNMVDALALTLIGSGLFMGGIVTTWLTLDLLRLRKLRPSWLMLGIVSGLFAIPAPFVLPVWWLPLLSAATWILWSGYLVTRGDPPSAYTEWKGL